MPLLESGGVFPPEEDRARLLAYQEFKYWYDGSHEKALDSKRATERLNAISATTGGLEPESIVYLVFNLPRLHCEKFADMQLLRAPDISIENMPADTEQDWLADVERDVPDWRARLHQALQYKRAYGDAGVVTRRKSNLDADGLDADGMAAKEEITVDLREVEPFNWFPVISDDDPLEFTAHQIAWVETVTDTATAQEDYFLHVEVYERNRYRKRKFVLEGNSGTASSQGLLHTYDIKDEIQDDGTEEPALDGFAFIHLPNGRASSLSPFGRSDFQDVTTLFDELDNRLSVWAEAADEHGKPYQSFPLSWLKENEAYGSVVEPSQHARRFYQTKERGEDSEPGYIAFDFDSAPQQAVFEKTLLATLMRLQLSPALLGWQFGNEKESGEAKSLGMSTTEAAAQRDLLQTDPCMRRALRALLRLKGAEGAEVSITWRVGLPKTEAELMAEVKVKQAMGLLTKKQALKELYPTLSEEEIESRLAELAEERKAEMQEEMAALPSTAFTG